MFPRCFTHFGTATAPHGEISSSLLPPRVDRRQMHKLVTLTIDPVRPSAEPGGRTGSPPVPGGLPGQVERTGHELCLELELPDSSVRFLVDVLLGLSEQDPTATLDLLVRLAVRKRLQEMSGTKGTLFDDVLGSVEAMVIGETFDQCDRVQTRTAALLGIDRNTLYKKLKIHQLLKSSGTTGPSSAAEPE